MGNTTIGTNIRRSQNVLANAAHRAAIRDDDVPRPAAAFASAAVVPSTGAMDPLERGETYAWKS